GGHAAVLQHADGAFEDDQVRRVGGPPHEPAHAAEEPQAPEQHERLRGEHGDAEERRPAAADEAPHGVADGYRRGHDRLHRAIATEAGVASVPRSGTAAPASAIATAVPSPAR